MKSSSVYSTEIPSDQPRQVLTASLQLLGTKKGTKNVTSAMILTKPK